MEHLQLRKLIREMFGKRLAKSGESVTTSNGNVVPNTTEKTAITVIGDPLEDVELNALVINPQMPKTGAKPHVGQKPQTVQKTVKRQAASPKPPK